MPVSVLVSAPASVSMFFPSLSAKGYSWSVVVGEPPLHSRSACFPMDSGQKRGVGFR